MIVLDTSSVIALMLDEPGADALGHRLAMEPLGERFMSVASYVEAGSVMAFRAETPHLGVRDLDDFVQNFGIQLAPVDSGQAAIAIDARIRFGRGFKTSAKLNFGDTFAYALAKSLSAPLLFVGDDFTHTDITSALPATL